MKKYPQKIIKRYQFGSKLVLLEMLRKHPYRIHEKSFHSVVPTKVDLHTHEPNLHKFLIWLRAISYEMLWKSPI